MPATSKGPRPGDPSDHHPATGDARPASAPSPAVALDSAGLLIRLESLAVFRGLLADPVVAALRDLLACLACGPDAAAPSSPARAAAAAGAYATLVARLFQSGSPGLEAHVRDALDADVNPYVRALGRGEVPGPAMEACVSAELATLQSVAGIRAADLAAPLRELGCPADALPALPDAPVGPDGPAPSSSDEPSGPDQEAPGLAACYRRRVADIGRYGYGDFARHRAFALRDDGGLELVAHPDPTRLSDLVGYEGQHAVVLGNTRALLDGRPAANILLAGDAGTGKSATVKAVANELAPLGLRILEIRKDQLRLIPALMDRLGENPLRFILFIDDLSFSSGDDDYAALKAVLEGSVSAKPANVAIYATSNRRHLVRETFSDREGDEVHLNDTLQETVSLSARFGIRLTYDRPDKAAYLGIVHRLAERAGLAGDLAALDAAAERFALQAGGRSARAARQLVDSLLAGSATGRV